MTLICCQQHIAVRWWDSVLEWRWHGKTFAKKLVYYTGRIFNQVPKFIGITMAMVVQLCETHLKREDALTSAKCASCCGVAWDGMSHNNKQVKTLASKQEDSSAKCLWHKNRWSFFLIRPHSPRYVLNFLPICCGFFQLLADTFAPCTSVSFPVAHSINVRSLQCVSIFRRIHVFHSLTLTANVAENSHVMRRQPTAK